MTPSEPSTPSDLRARALGHLRDLTGNPSADFHPGQFEAVSALVEGHRRALVVQRTGWGKSAVYFLSALLMRAQGYGPTLIISPLLALMRDQVSAAQRAGVRAAAISSANPTEWAEISSALDRGEVDVLLVSPERLNNPRFRDEQLPQLMDRLGLLVVDEAHCISDWGHDFRPDYRRIKDMLAQLPDSVAVLATTATANERVIEDVREQLGVGSGYGGEVFTLRGPLSRASLRLGVLRLPSTSARLAWLLAHLDELPGSGIIYALTIGAAEDTAQALTDAGHRVAAYTGRTDAAEREDLEAALKDNQVKALVATSALGMGFDKPDLGFVVHLGAPSSPVAYYQQVGRAGRATDTADVLLLPGREDRDIWEYFATASMPTEEKATAVLTALAEHGGPLSVAALEPRVNIKRSPLELLLKVLAVDGAVERVGGGWQSTGRPWHYDAPRYDRVGRAREAEQRAMLDYQVTDGCRMQFLTRQLDDPSGEPCGRCDVCAGPWYPTDVDPEVLGDAAQVGALPRTGPGGDRPVVDAQGRVGDHELLRHIVDRAQPAAARAGTGGGVGGEGLGLQPGRALRIGTGPGIQHAQQVGQRGDGPHAGARAGCAPALLQGHGGGKTGDLGDVRRTHLLQQPARVGGHGLEIAPLRLGVERAERQRGLTGSAHPREGDECAPGDVHIHRCQIVLRRAANVHVPVP